MKKMRNQLVLRSSVPSNRELSEKLVLSLDSGVSKLGFSNWCGHCIVKDTMEVG